MYGPSLGSHPDLPRHSGFDSDYWLSRCEGFRVDSPHGRLGQVEWLRYASRQDRPDALVIRAGRFRRRLLVIPVAEVEDIDPEAERIFLRALPWPTR